MTDTIRLYGLVTDSIVDGPGFRTSIFTQGCPHHCPGCHNPGSHDFEAGTVYSLSDVEAKFSRKEPQPEEHASLTRMFVMMPWSSQMAFMSWPPISRRNVMSGMYWNAALAWATVSTTWYSVENALENKSSPYPVEPQPKISRVTPASR